MNPVPHWPLKAPPIWPDAPGHFGARRKFDYHTGIDLYCPLGTEVVAVEAGTVVLVEWFTGTLAGSPWWNDTQAVLVEGASGVLVYGEINPFVAVGQSIRAGDVLGVVDTPVLKRFKGRPTTMLHFEWMTPGSRTTLWWPVEHPQCPPNLKDPTPLLHPLYLGQVS